MSVNLCSLEAVVRLCGQSREDIYYPCIGGIVFIHFKFRPMKEGEPQPILIEEKNTEEATTGNTGDMAKRAGIASVAALAGVLSTGELAQAQNATPDMDGGHTIEMQQEAGTLNVQAVRSVAESLGMVVDPSFETDPMKLSSTLLTIGMHISKLGADAMKNLSGVGPNDLIYETNISMLRELTADIDTMQNAIKDNPAAAGFTAVTKDLVKEFAPYLAQAE
jgi:hypothetical protein